MTVPHTTRTSSRHPATWGAFGAAVTVGAWGLFVPGGQSNVVDLALPDWWSSAYYALLGIGGLCGLSALLIDGPDKRIRAERACWYVIGWFSLLYGVAAFYYVGAAAGQAAILVGAYSPVATARIWQITRELRARRDGTDEEEGPAS